MQEFLESERDSLESTKVHFIQSIKWPLLVVLILFIVHGSQVLIGWDAREFGIVPRLLIGIRGVASAPFVHGSWGHLFSNSIPLFVLFSIICYFYQRSALRAVLMITVITGFTVWIFGRVSSHIGASGVVFGMFGYMLANGIFRRNNKSILLSLLILMVYGGMFLGLSSDQTGVSYESHWSGLFAGFFTSFWFKEELEADEIQDKKMPDPNDAEKILFLPRDIFDKTKAQRAFEEAERRRKAEEARIQLEMERLRLAEEERIRQNIERFNNGDSFWDSTIT